MCVHGTANVSLTLSFKAASVSISHCLSCGRTVPIHIYARARANYQVLRLTDLKFAQVIVERISSEDQANLMLDASFEPTKILLLGNWFVQYVHIKASSSCPHHLFLFIFLFLV